MEQTLWQFAQITTFILFGVMAAAVAVGIASIYRPHKWGNW